MVVGWNKEVNHQCECFLWHLAKIEKLTSFITPLTNEGTTEETEGNVSEKTTLQVTNIQNSQCLHYAIILFPQVLSEKNTSQHFQLHSPLLLTTTFLLVLSLWQHSRLPLFSWHCCRPSLFYISFPLSQALFCSTAFHFPQCQITLVKHFPPSTLPLSLTPGTFDTWYCPFLSSVFATSPYHLPSFLLLSPSHSIVGLPVLSILLLFRTRYHSGDVPFQSSTWQ